MDIQQMLLDAITKTDAISDAHRRAGIKLKEALAEIRSVTDDATPKQNLNVTFNINLLSDREREIFELISDGLKPRNIAEKLGKSIKTIEAQRDAVRKKLGFPTSHDLTQAARMAKRISGGS